MAGRVPGTGKFMHVERARGYTVSPPIPGLIPVPGSPIMMIVGCHLLIVDDEKEMRISLSKILSSAGFESEYTTHPLEVKRLLAEKHFDLVIMDIRMPEISGLDLLQQLRAALKSIPVIIVSAYASVENIVAAMKVGALNFYQKPINIDMLIAEIRRITHSSRESGADTALHPLDASSPRMAEALKQSRKIAGTGALVFLFGERGTARKWWRTWSTRTARAPTARLSRSTAHQSPKRFSRASFSDTSREPSPTRSIYIEDASRSTRRNAVLRRDQRDRHGDAGEAPAGFAGQGVQTPGRLRRSSRRPDDRRHEHRHPRPDREEALPGRTSITASWSLSFRCRRCGSAGKTFFPWHGTFLTFSARPTARPSPAPWRRGNLMCEHSWPWNVRELKNCVHGWLPSTKPASSGSRTLRFSTRPSALRMDAPWSRHTNSFPGRSSWTHSRAARA